MKKLFIAASALVLSLSIGFAVVSTNKVEAQASPKCEVRAEQPTNHGKVMYDEYEKKNKKFTKENGKAYIRVVVEGDKGCSKVVSLVAWKTHSLSGKPFKDQVIHEDKQATIKAGDSKLMEVEIPKCFFQIDLVRGLNPEGNYGGGAYQEGRMIHSVRGGDKTCFPETKTPEYKCVNLNISSTVPRTVTVTDFKTSAKNGATYKRAVINWGDGTTTNVTNNAVNTSHDYAKDGTYSVRATAYFMVDGKEKVAEASAKCVKNVTFNGQNPPVVTPPTETPTNLPVTGPGAVAAIFTGVSTFAGAAHFFITRRLGL